MKKLINLSGLASPHLSRKLTYLLLLLVTLMTGANDAWAVTSITSGQNYYIQNVESGLFLCGANNWGTQASVSVQGELFTVTTSGEGYTITNTALTGSTKTLGYNLFTDTNTAQNGNVWTIADADNGTFSIHGSGMKDEVADAFNGYLAQSATAGAHIGYLVEGVNSVTDAAKWRFLTEAEAKAWMPARTPANVSFLIGNANFSRNHSDVWTFSYGLEDGHNENKASGNTNNFCSEAYHQTFNVYQTLTGLPNGTYGVTAQGFCRVDNEGTNTAVFYANDETKAFPIKTGAESSMANASTSFSSGLYTIDEIRVEVTNGNLTIGVKNEDCTTLWCIWDNFQLTYYGGSTIKSQDGSTTTWNFTQVTEELAASMTNPDMGSWVKDSGGSPTYYGTPLSNQSAYWAPSWCEGLELGLNQRATDQAGKARIYYKDSNKYYNLNGSAASLKVTIPENSNTLTVTANNEVASNTSSVTFTVNGDGTYKTYTATVTPGSVVEIHRKNSASTNITQVQTSYVEPEVSGLLTHAVINGGGVSTVTGAVGGTVEKLGISSTGKLSSPGSYILVRPATGTFKTGDKVIINLNAAGSNAKFYVFNSKNADDAHKIYDFASKGALGDNEFTLTADADAICLYRDGTYCTWNGAINYIDVIRGEYVPEVIAPKADFIYGYTTWTKPEAGDVTITLPAHKAGSTITLDVTPEDGASVDEVLNGTYAANKLTFTAPAAGSNMTVTFPVTKDEATTEYSIVVTTERKVGQNFDPEKRYSEILIDARKDNFYSNTNSGGLGYDRKDSDKSTSILDYVPGLVAKGIIEAVDWYKDHKTATINDTKLSTWYNAVKTYGEKAISANGKAGKSFDDLNAAKIYFGLKSVANQIEGSEVDKTAWNEKLGLALTGIKSATTTYAISSSHASYPITIANMQGGLWHKADYINQMWGDGQYMGTAFLAQLINDADVYNASNADKRVTTNDWDFVTKQLTIYHTYAWDNTYNLPHHAFAADQGNGAGAALSHSDTWKFEEGTYHNEGIWARAAGWYFMALVDVLEQMQKANVTGANYNTVKGYLDAVAAGVKARQDAATGLWYQLPIYDETFSAADYETSSSANPGRKFNYLESSASALFTAAYLKAMRLGFLDKGTYEATAKKAYQGFIENFIDNNNNIYWSCRSAGLGGKGADYIRGGSKYRNGSNDYYLKGYDVARVSPDDNLTEGKALGAFLMAAVEYEREYLAADELVCGDSWEAQKTSTHPLASGQTMHITFNNVSNKPAEGGNPYDGWHNWILAAGTSDAENHNKMALRADKYDINTSAQMGEIKLNDGDINWTTFVEDMKAGADVDIYVSNSGSNLYVKAVSTATNSGNVYTYTAQNSNSADNVYISLMGQNCTLTKIEFEDPVAAVTINATESNTSARIKNGMGLILAKPSAIQAGETIVLEAKANDGFMFSTWKDAPAGTSIVASPQDDGFVYKYRIDALNASATVQAKAESTTVRKYNPTTNNNYYNFAIVDGIKDYVVEHGKGTGDYDMLNFANITGGVTTLYNGGSSDGAMVYAPAKTVNLNGSSAAYMKVELLNTNATGYTTVQVGDVITFTGSGELKISNTTSAGSISTTDKTYTVLEGDAIVGASTLYFFKNGSGQISTLNIMRPLPHHTITFNGNGNTGGSMEAQVVDEGIPTPIANNGFSRNAYILKGWNTAADGSGTNYVQNADITLTDDVTLYAMWQRFSPKGSQGATIVAEGGDVAGYTITFETSQNLSITSEDFEISSSDINILTAAFRDMSGGVRFNVHGVSAGAADVIIRFKGRENTLFGESECRVTFTVKAPDAPRTVTFDGSGNGASLEAALTETAVGSGITLPRVTPLAGHTFLGWSTRSDATKPDAGLTEGETYHPSDNTVLYAVYSTGTTIGNANTSFFGAFSDFVKLDEGKSCSATYNNRGGSETYNNWSVIATSNNTGHNGDGVQVDSGNELFVLRADGESWGVKKGEGKFYRSNDGIDYTELSGTMADASDERKAEFVEAMANATRVDFSASRVGEYVYMYVTTTCSNGKRYIETYKSGAIAADDPVYLSWTTDKSTITFSDQSTKNAYLVSGDSEGNGFVSVGSMERIDMNNVAVPAGTQIKYTAVPSSGYEFQKWSDETTENPTVKTINATTNLVASFVPAAYNYTVRAVDSKGNVLNANIASGTYTYGDPAVTVAYPQHILSDKTLYEIANNGSGYWFSKEITPDRQDYVYDLVYSKGTVDNVVYYTEAEDIAGFTKQTIANRASNAMVGYNNSAQQTTCVLPAGLYQIFIRGVNGNSATRAVIFTDGSNEIASLSIPNGTDQKSNSAIFQLTEQKTLYVSSTGSSSSGLDWFYVKKYDDVLMVTSNSQRYDLTKDNAADDAFFTSSTGTSNWAQKTINGQKEYVLDMKSNRTETVRVTGARSYEIIVMNNGENDVNLSVGGENKAITAKTTSSTGLIPINDPNGVTTISFTNTSGNTIYPYQIIFYTTDPKATLNTDEVTVKVGKTTTFNLSTASGGAITMVPTVTSNEYASAISFDANKLTMTGVSEGSFELTFDIAAGGGYTAATGYVLKVNVEKQMLTLKYSPEFYKYNADTGVETNNLTPTLSIQIEDEETGKLVDFTGATPTINYASDDTSIATVTSDGVIAKVGSGQGSADITAKVDDSNVTYTSNVAAFAVTIEQGVSLSLAENKTPAVGEELALTDASGENTLVYATFGGWKWGKNGDKNDHSYDFPGSSSAKTDSWAKTGQYTGSMGAKPNYVDGYSWQSGGKNDAADEYKGASNGDIFGKPRYGWFRPTSDPYITPFSLPVRGTYMTFEPQQNGMLTVYILQNGAFNSSTAADGTSKIIPGEFQPHSFHVVDHNGTPVVRYTTFDFIVKEHVTQKTKDGTLIVCNYDPSTDPDNGQVPAGATYTESDVATWPMFYSNFSKAERTAIKEAWASGKNGAQNVVTLHDGSFFITQKAYVKYSFYVAAGQKYYLFSNFSKLGFSGMNFVPDANQPLESDALTLNDNEAFPTLKNASTNVSKKLTIPQYGKITVNRTFTPGDWNTICLPFDMTEREVEECFGKGTVLQCFDGTEQNEHNSTLHFVYHEIQSILAGYPYLIKPTGTGVTLDGSGKINGITVKNKLIQPKNNGDAQHQNFDYTQPKGFVDFSTSRYWTNTPYVAETSGDYTFRGTIGAQTPYKKGDLYMSTANGGTWKRMTADSGNLKGYRAFIQSNSEDNYAKALFFSIGSRYDEEDDETTTAIYEVEFDENSEEGMKLTPVDGVYNLRGQKISKNLRNLPSGIYIVNGKKFYVK